MDSQFSARIEIIKNHIAERIKEENMVSKVVYDIGRNACYACIANENSGNGDTPPPTKENWDRILKKMKGHQIVKNDVSPKREFVDFQTRCTPDYFVVFGRTATFRRRMNITKSLRYYDFPLIAGFIAIALYCCYKFIPLFIIELKLHGFWV